MREPPAGITDAALWDALAAEFGVEAVALSFLPLGHDSSAWVYRVDAAGGRAFFLKVRAAVTNPAALLVPRHLQQHGAAHVVAPLATVSGALWAEVGGHALILYPFIAGETGMARRLRPEQWQAYGAALRQIHAAPVGGKLAALLRRERYEPAGLDELRRLEAHLGAREPADAEERELGALWRANKSAIATMAARAEELGRRLARAPLPELLCHADIHTGNVLSDAEGRIWIVDWDEALLAPRERDLMFVAGGISARLVGPEEEAWFFEGYGPARLDPVAMAYYRAAWAVGDIAAFGAEICFRPDLGPVSRREALRLWASLFAPGEIVAIALASPADEHRA
jgi:spectinomycin phosphotransferase